MPVAWRIESAIEDIQAAGTQGFTRGVKVGWVTDTGLRGTVFVPDNLYTADNVAQMVTAAVANAVNVAGLSGSV